MFNRFLIVMVVGFASLSLSVPSGHASDVAEPPAASKYAVRTITKATEKAYRGRNPAALKVYERALGKTDLNQDDRSILKKYLANLLMQMQRYDEAIKTLDGVSFENHRRDQHLLTRYHYNLLNGDQFHHAFKLLQAYGTGLSNADEMHYLAALRIYANLGMMDEVQALLLEFVQNHPRSKLANEAYLASLATDNREATILSRATPMMTARAVRSGDCQLSVRVAETGRVSDVRQVSCTESMFEENSVIAARKFLFFPALIDGKAVPSTVENIKVTYKLANAKGEIIPARKR